MRQVSHKTIVRLIHIYDSDESVDLVMEYMGGGDLVQYMKVKPALSEEQAAKVLFTVLSALAYLHDQKIIHRDIKLENIMLRYFLRWLTISNQEDIDTSEFKIIDFGLAIKYNKVTQAKTSCGSMAYAGKPPVL